VFTPRGTVLRNGDLLQADDGRVIRVTATAEATYRIDCATPRDLLRCAFHIGNRHTQAQVGYGFLRIRIDSVLKDMLEGLGASVTEEMAAFEPESGAYAGAHGPAHAAHPLAPVPLRQKIHRPSDVDA
jgi:urease accessory protein